MTKSLSKSDANVGEGIGKVPVKKQENSNHLQQPSSIDRDNCFQVCPLVSLSFQVLLFSLEALIYYYLLC